MYEVVRQMNKLPDDSSSVYLATQELLTGALITFGLPVHSAMKRESFPMTVGGKYN